MLTAIYLIAITLSCISAFPAQGLLGQPCSTQHGCLEGAQCHAINSTDLARCGNSQAACSSSAQCAVNSCVDGACTGPVAPTLPLGQMCYTSRQCVFNAGCYAVNDMLIPRCGNFQANCTADFQCAFNTCRGGACNGFVSSSSSSSSTITTVVVSLSGTFSTGDVLATSGAVSSVTAVTTLSFQTTSTAPAPPPTVSLNGGRRMSVGLFGKVVTGVIGSALMLNL